MANETIKICYPLRGVHYCPKCGAIYFRKTECNCPNENPNKYK